MSEEPMVHMTENGFSILMDAARDRMEDADIAEQLLAQLWSSIIPLLYRGDGSHIQLEGMNAAQIERIIQITGIHPPMPDISSLIDTIEGLKE